MAGLSVGTVPPYYREAFDALSPDGATISKEVWMKVFKTSKLSAAIISQIWMTCDSSEMGSISRDGLYKSLALCALGQQGKGVEEKSLLAIGDAELPKPDLCALSEWRSMCMQVLRATRPTELGYTYEDVKNFDEISLSIVPEKKGMVFKHVEYLVESKSLKSAVHRRYRDFEAFGEALLNKYPYRLVPRIPPKKLTPSPAFLEQRRRALRRFLTLIVHHPVLSKDEVVRFFLTAGGQEVGSRLKEKFKIHQDEFFFNPLARHAEELVDESTRVKFERVSEQIAVMQQVLSSMLQIAHNMEHRSLGLSQDIKTLSTNMTTLATNNLLLSSWTSGSDDAWSYLQSSCERLSGSFAELSDKAKQQGVRETSGFTESVHLFLDLVTSYMDLCERREKTVQRKHQKAFTKVQTMVNYKERMESTGRHLSEKEDGRIIKRDDELIVIEKRNFFSLFCLDLEAQLVHVNLTQVTEIYEHLITAQVKGHVEYLSSWDGMKGVLEDMHSQNSRSIGISSSSPTSSLTTATRDQLSESRSPPRSTPFSSTKTASPFT